MVINCIGEKVDLLTQLLPSPEHLQFQRYELDLEQRQIHVGVESIQKTVCCPVCGQAAHRLHSSYERTLADLPWADYQITIHLTVGKFFCEQETCKRKIFTERIAGVMAPWVRRTQRLAAQLIEIGLRAGGEGGAKLSQKLHCGVSQNTLLSLIRRQSMPVVSVPKTLGVDDFAWRRGQRYGTILVDLDAHQPIALLPDREAETLAQWLQAHPGVEVLSRDRSQAYKQGMTKGGPAAIQVADRFHLLKNLAESLEQVFREHMPTSAPEASSAPILTPSPVLPPEIEPADFEHAQAVRRVRLARYQQVWDLHRAGWQQKAIAQQLGIGERTVARYLQHPTFPERRERKDRGRSLLDPYQAQLLKHWNQGCRDARQLYQMLQQEGYQASYSTVARYVRRLRQAQGLKKRQRRTSSPLPPLRAASPPLTARKATWIVLRRPENCKSEELEQLDQLLTRSPTLTIAVHLTQQFIEMVRTRLPEQLDPWLSDATTSSLSSFARFAQGIREDYAAVKAALTLSWSNGQVEGQINRLKTLKRQMYGRASFDLLNRRLVLTS